MDNSGDYISREAAYESLLNGMVMTGYQSRALDCISEFSLPAADVRPVVRGKWAWNDNNGYYFCDKCGTVSPRENQDGDYIDCPNFCPNCGADMSPEPPKEGET